MKKGWAWLGIQVDLKITSREMAAVTEKDVLSGTIIQASQSSMLTDPHPPVSLPSTGGSCLGYDGYYML